VRKTIGDDVHDDRAGGTEEHDVIGRVNDGNAFAVH